MNVSVLSYLIAAIGCLLVALLGTGARLQGRTGTAFTLVAAATALWATAWSLRAAGFPVPELALWGASMARYFGLFYLMWCLTTASLPRWLLVLAVAIAALDLLTVLFAHQPALPAILRWFAGAMPRAQLLLAFIGLVLVEQFVRSSGSSELQGARPLAIGVGGQFAYDLFLFSQAEMLGEVDSAAWAVRGLVVAMTIPMLVYGMRQLRGQQPIFVSRHVVFYTTAMVAVGLYLVAMAIGGYYVRLLGRDWGPVLQVAFMLGAVVVLAAVLTRGGLWRRLRVFISKHFYRNKYDYRVEWLRFISTLSAAQGEDIVPASIRAVGQIIGSPGGFVLLRGPDVGVFRPHGAWPESLQAQCSDIELPESAPLVQFVARRQWVLHVQQLQRERESRGMVELPHWLQEDPRLGIVVPLLAQDRLMGLMVLRSPPPPFSLNFEDHDLLRTLGRHIAVHIGQHLADQRLAENRQFDAYNRLAAFVMHDLKNAVAQLQLVVSNAARHRNNPVFIDDAIETIANSVERMTRLIDQLSSPEVADRRRDLVLADVIDGAVQRAGRRVPAPRAGELDRRWLVSADPERLSTVFEHVMRNAQDAATHSGNVIVEAAAHAGRVSVAIIDDGPGMSAEFMKHRLFKPFESTKGSRGMGIGAFQAREYIREIGGDVEVQSSPGLGTRFCITLPLCQTPDQNYS